MNPLFPQEELTRLGVDSAALGQMERLSVPAPRATAGDISLRKSSHVEDIPEISLAARAILDDSPPVFSMSVPSSDMVDVQSDVFDGLGIAARYDGRRRLVTLRPLAEWPMTLSITGADPSEPARGFQATPAVVSHSAALRLPLFPGTRFVISDQGELPLALGQVKQRELWVQPVYPWPAPPLDEWADRGLGDEVRNRAAGRPPSDRWALTTRAGALARWGMVSSRTDVRSTLAAAREGRPSNELKPRIWMRSLSTAQRDVVEQFARVRARRLAARLVWFLERLTPDVPELVERWKALCYQRDDLEGIRVVLREAGAGLGLEQALREADEPGRAVRFSWPGDVEAHDEQLRRAALSNPGAWWGSTRYATQLL